MPDASGSSSPDPAESTTAGGSLAAPNYPFPLRRLLILLVFVPIAWLGMLMYAYGVDTPYWDEWDETPVGLEKIHDGTLSWSDLTAQHNEHRILFPRIVMLATAWLTSWNTRAELLVIWLLACLCSFNLWRLSRVTGFTGTNFDLMLMIAVNVLLFTPVAFENWLWGFQVGFLLPLAALTMAIWLVSASRLSLAFFFAIVLSFICTFSMASGFLCWLIVLPLLLFREGKWQWRDRVPGLLCWFVGLAGSGALYLHGYVRQGEGPKLLHVVEQPGAALSYLLAYFGSAYGWCIGFNTVLFSGGVLLVLFFGALVYLWRFRADTQLIAQTLPWGMLATYSFLNGVVTMIGRLDFGLVQATAPRYITFAVMLPIGLLFILRKIYLHWRSGDVTLPQIQVFRTTLVVCAVLGLGANIYCSFAILNQWQYWRKARLLSKTLVEFVLVTREEKLTNEGHLTYGDFDKLREHARRMGELGYLRPAPVTGAEISHVADPNEKPSAEHGFFDGVVRTQDGRLCAFGWAVLPGDWRPADLVLLTYDEAAHPGVPMIFGVTMTGYQRSDVARTTHQPDYELSGWAKLLTPGLLPPGPHHLRAWAFNPQENHAYPIDGGAEFDENPPAPVGKKKP